MADEQVSATKSISWSAAESHFFEKTSTWYIGSAILAGLLVIFGLWQSNLLFVLFVVIAEVLALFWGGQAPRTLTYELSEAGFTVGDKIFRFDTLIAYALVESLGGPNFYELVFQQKQSLSLYVKAFVPNTQAPQVGEFLASRLPVFEYSPSLSEAIMNRFGL
jgi:hypothetical protein